MKVISDGEEGSAVPIRFRGDSEVAVPQGVNVGKTPVSGVLYYAELCAAQDLISEGYK